MPEENSEESTEIECSRGLPRWQVRGTPSILNKFTLPLVLLDLGVEVFWVDFDVTESARACSYYSSKEVQKTW